MKTKTFLGFVIAELNTLQVKELIEFGKEHESEADKKNVKLWEDRQWKTILLSLNNAATPPTKENPLGSDTTPKSREDIEPSLGFASFGELRDAIMDLSGLRTAAVGESKAAETN